MAGKWRYFDFLGGLFYPREKKKWTGNLKWTETSPIRNVLPQINQKSLTPSFCIPKMLRTNTLRRTHTQGYVDTPRSSRCPGQRDRRSWRERGDGGGTPEDGWAPRAVKLPCVEACCTICVETINATDHCCRRSPHTQPGPEDSRGQVQATLYFLMKTETGSEQFSDILWGILLLLRFTTTWCWPKLLVWFFLLLYLLYLFTVFPRFSKYTHLFGAPDSLYTVIPQGSTHCPYRAEWSLQPEWANWWFRKWLNWSI